MNESRTRRLLRARDAIDADITRGWTTAELARIAFLSPTHFRRTFREAFGEGPRAYLYRRRIGRAKVLLRSTDTRVTEIALLVGYDSLGTFTRTFARLTGETPTAWRARGPLPPIPSCVVREALHPGTGMVVPEKSSADLSA